MTQAYRFISSPINELTVEPASALSFGMNHVACRLALPASGSRAEAEIREGLALEDEWGDNPLEQSLQMAALQLGAADDFLTNLALLPQYLSGMTHGVAGALSQLLEEFPDPLERDRAMGAPNLGLPTMIPLSATTLIGASGLPNARWHAMGGIGRRGMRGNVAPYAPASSLLRSIRPRQSIDRSTAHNFAQFAPS